ncbi:MAG: DUF1599 domain-containing protein, partial [Prevotellaceae bacterium]|nr:DUF1599 domain-containing protein [Prevotellaceae bacterium]
YSPSWRILRLTSVTDQILNKAKRIRQIGESGVALVNEGVEPEFVGLVNYSIIGLIQLELGPTLEPDLTNEEAMALYDKYAKEAFELMKKKNHDYDEAWRGMRISSMTDLILVKLYRVKQIEDHKGKTDVSEGIASNYFDIINYAVFSLIKLRYEPKA